MANILEISAKNLRDNRRKCGLTQSKLAEMADISTHYIALIELARNIPKVEVIERLANALDIELYELFVENHSPAKELERLRDDMMVEIKKTITETVIDTVREAFEENNKRCSSKLK